MPKAIAIATAAGLVLCLATLASAAADLSTPQSATKAFRQAMYDGDVEGAKAAAATSSEDEEKALEMIVKISGARRKMVDAAVAKFGEEGRSLEQRGPRGGGGGGGGGADRGGPPPSFEEQMKRIDEADVKIEGDTATLTPEQGPPTHLKKVGNDWKVDFSQMGGMGRMAQDPSIAQAMQKIYTDLASDIEAGKFKSAEEARAAMREKMMALRGIGGGMSGGAATRPSNR